MPNNMRSGIVFLVLPPPRDPPFKKSPPPAAKAVCFVTLFAFFGNYSLEQHIVKASHRKRALRLSALFIGFPLASFSKNKTAPMGQGWVLLRQGLPLNVISSSYM